MCLDSIDERAENANYDDGATVTNEAFLSVFNLRIIKTY